MRRILSLISRPAQMEAATSSSSSPSEGPTQTPYADSPIFMLSLPDDNHFSSPASASAAAAAASTRSPVSIPPESLGEFLMEEENGGCNIPVATAAQALGRRRSPEKTESTVVKPGPSGGRRKSFAVKKKGSSKRFLRGARIMRSSSSSGSDSSPDERDARRTPEQTVGAQLTEAPQPGDPRVGGRDLRDDAHQHHRYGPAEPAAPNVDVCLEKTHDSIARVEHDDGGVRTEDLGGQEARSQFLATAEGVVGSRPQKLISCIGNLRSDDGMRINVEDTEGQAESENRSPPFDIAAAAAHDAEGVVYSGPSKRLAIIGDPLGEGGMRVNGEDMKDHAEAREENPATSIATAAATETTINNPDSGEKNEDNIFPSRLLQMVTALMDHHQPNKLNAATKMMYPDGCDRRLDNIDVLDILEMKGIKIPQPRWYRPGGYNA